MEMGRQREDRIKTLKSTSKLVGIGGENRAWICCPTRNMDGGAQDK